MTMPADRRTSREMRTDSDEISVIDWIWLSVIALFLMPIAGVIAALLALDITRSFQVHVATGAVLPAALVALVARRFGASGGVVLRLALMAALFALVLLDMGWSGATG
jgi:hypothetical protein